MLNLVTLPLLLKRAHLALHSQIYFSITQLNLLSQELREAVCMLLCSCELRLEYIGGMVLLSVSVFVCCMCVCVCVCVGGGGGVLK